MMWIKQNNCSKIVTDCCISKSFICNNRNILIISLKKAKCMLLLCVVKNDDD